MTTSPAPSPAPSPHPPHLPPTAPSPGASWHASPSAQGPARRAGALASLVFVTVATLCVLGGGAAAWYIQQARPRGAAAPATAVDGFLNAIFAEHSPRAAEDFVCPAARDTAELAELVDTATQMESGYSSPRTTWSFPAITTDGVRARTEVTLTLNSAGSPVASKRLSVELLEQRGWWVCAVEPAG